MTPLPIRLYIQEIAIGTTISPERYDFADIEARYVKITINGNNQNEWASITEIEINGQGDRHPVGPDPEPDSDTTPPSVKITSPAADSAIINARQQPLRSQYRARHQTTQWEAASG